MKKEIIDEIRRLVVGQRVLSLGVLRDGDPYVSMLPYVVLPDVSGVIVHVSRLALHSAGLTDGSRFSVLIHTQDDGELDPLRIPRVSLSGTVVGVARDTHDYEMGKQLYLHRFPDSIVTFGLGDFSLYQLRFDSGRYVGGFARARSLGPRDIGALNPAGGRAEQS